MISFPHPPQNAEISEIIVVESCGDSSSSSSLLPSLYIYLLICNGLFHFPHVLTSHASSLDGEMINFALMTNGIKNNFRLFLDCLRHVDGFEATRRAMKYSPGFVHGIN